MWMRKSILVAVAVAAAAAVGVPEPALAAEPPKAKPAATAASAASAQEMPGPLADFWTFWAKPGHEAEFEAGVKVHLAWRKQAREGWFWEAYQPIVGTDLSHVIFRSGEHRWADFDAQQAWEEANKAGEAFARDVAPHLERYEHTIAESDYANSQWAMGVDYKYFWVVDHKLKSGMSGAIAEATTKIHQGLQAAGWKKSYALSRTIGGPGGLTLVFPYATYAEMEDPKPGFMEVLATGMGSQDAAKAVLEQFDAAVEETNTTFYVARPDLSTQR